MLRNYFLWRARRRWNRNRYRLDRRRYRGPFSAGFFGHLRHSRFWDGSDEAYKKRMQRRALLLWTWRTLLLIGLVWLVYQSSGITSVFAP